MNIALLGIDDDTLDLAQAALEAGHALVAAYDVDAAGSEALRKLLPRIEISEAWENLLSREAADAVIVARASDDDRRADQLRKLVQEGVPMIVAHPVHDSMLIYYELDMIRQESLCPMLPYSPERWHPAVERLAELTDGDGAAVGRLEQLTCERFLADRSKRSVVAHFVRDVEVLRLLAGDTNKIGAMAGSPASVDYANLGVQMSGPSGVAVRWTVGPAEPGIAFRLMAIGQRGKLTLTASDDQRPWMIETRVGGEAKSESIGIAERADDPPSEALALLAEAMTGAEVTPTWIDAARDMELADGIERSVQRGRTIDLHFEEQTEQGTFKGMMAAGGCLLLMATLALVVVGALLGGAGVPIVQHWPYLMVVVLGGFLLLQFLRLAFPPKNRE